MATTTPNLNMQKPDVGGDANVWGTQLNGNLDILDTEVQNALNGVAAADDTAKQLIVDMLNLQEPIGTVKFLNTADPVPAGWEECDGTGGTAPNLTEKTLVAALASQRGRLRGLPVWSVDNYSGASDEAGAHTHSLSGVVDTYAAFSAGHILTKAQLPAEPLAIGWVNSETNSVLTGVSTPNFAFDAGGTGANFYYNYASTTENMGSGQAHSHSITHTHTLSGNGQAAPAGVHTHNTLIATPANVAMRLIQKVRLLVVGDFP